MSVVFKVFRIQCYLDVTILQFGKESDYLFKNHGGGCIDIWWDVYLSSEHLHCKLDVIVIGVLIYKSNHCSIVTWISRFITSVSFMSTTSPHSNLCTNGTAPREGSSMALLICLQIDFCSLSIVQPLHLSSSPEDFEWIRQSQRCTWWSPSACPWRVANLQEHASSPLRHYFFVNRQGVGVPAFRASHTVLLLFAGQSQPFISSW